VVKYFKDIRREYEENMIRTIFIAVAIILLSSLLAYGSDFSLYRDDKGHWIIEFIDEEHPRDSHTITITLNGRVWKEEVSASNQSKFDTKLNTDERPSVHIDEYE
jgi:hypothetical protein